MQASDQRTATAKRVQSALRVAAVFLLYLALSALCVSRAQAFAWIPAELSALALALLGPPAVLLWGWDERNTYLLATACVFIPLVALWRTKARGCGLTLAAGAWIFWGLLSWAASF